MFFCLRKLINNSFKGCLILRICHISDTHGNFPKLKGNYDLIVHSGDFFPNYHVMNRNITKEILFQREWLNDNLYKIKTWLQKRPIIFILGNHDFLSPSLMENILVEYGIDAINITDKIISFNEINFYGFPYVPIINGVWNYEKNLSEMEIEVNKMVKQLNKNYVNVLVTHSPLYRFLDLTDSNDLIGNTIVTNALDFKLNKSRHPTHLLHGHCHEANGLSIKGKMLISNAACTYHIIEM